MIKKNESIEKLVRTYKQGEEVQAKDIRKDLALWVPLRIKDDLPIDLATYSVTTSEKPENTQYPKGYTECKCEPICMKDLKDIKQGIASYDMHSPYVKLIKT